MRTGEKQSLEDFSIVRSYPRWEGLLPVGVCSDDPNEEIDFIRTSSPIEMLSIAWTATNIGTPPPIPSPDLLDPNNVLLMSDIQPAAPGVTHDGLQIWTVQGTYLYAIRKPRGRIRDLPTGKLPFDSASASENTIPSSFFVHNLMGDGGGGGPNDTGTDSYANPPQIYQGITTP